MKRLAILICLTFLLTTDAHSWSLFGPKNYEDCIIDGLKGVTSDVAVKEIKKACRKKFPLKIRKLSKTEIDNIVDIDRVKLKCYSLVGTRYNCYTSVRIINRNHNLTIRSIRLEIRYRGDRAFFYSREWERRKVKKKPLPLIHDPDHNPDHKQYYVYDEEKRWVDRATGRPIPWVGEGISKAKFNSMKKTNRLSSVMCQSTSRVAKGLV